MNFRNLKDKQLKFDPKFNLFLGKNGQGKTSILEAIYFAVSGQSFRTKHLKEIIRYGNIKLGSLVSYKDRFDDKSICVKTIGTKKEFYYNKKKTKYSEFLGRVNIISFIPEDINLITGSPMLRRAFFDYEISQSNVTYYEFLKDYNKVLKVRNSYLKSRDTSNPLYEIYNEKFYELASKIILMRKEYVKKISILLNLNYRKLFDEKSELNLKYSSFSEELDKKSSEEIKDLLIEKQKKVDYREKSLGYSLVGPQKDDYVFELNNNSAKSFSSQGEKKSIIFALKIAEIDMIIKDKGEAPVFLIDDISSYFDALRKASIIKYFENRNVQVFLSSTESLGIKSKNFYVSDGDVSELSE
jgi:DNA replication and repair protein RecF